MSGHHHDHGHSHGETYGKAFAIGIALNLGFVAAEWVAGILSGSMALMADAGHNLGDAAGLTLAWIAYALSRRKPSGIFTYGLGRSSILAALFNALLLMAAVGAVSWEAIRRMSAPQPIATGTVMIVAAIGILVNGFTALLFLRGRKTDLNLRGAFLHMSLDALVSVGVVITGFLVRRTGWVVLDPIASLVISALILYSTWDLLRDAMRLILDGVPEGISMQDVEACLLADERVLKVHDLHVWSTSTTKTVLSAHIVVSEGLAPDPLLCDLSKQLHDRFEILHSTIQIEHGDPDYPCHIHH
jgi:cobalt-zinc-cadmium efflux system protein